METFDPTAQGVEGAVKPFSADEQTDFLMDSIQRALAVVDDHTREGLRDTPKRWSKMFMELTSGHDFEMTTFENPGYDEMVVERGIQFYSLCEHHLAPFFGTAAVGYIPGKRIVGISKLCRTVDSFARRLQVQERMTQQVADKVQTALEPKGVGVVIRARHLCQEMRGVRKSGVETVTACFKGALLEKQAARDEFMRLAQEGSR